MRQNINANNIKKIDAELYNANYYDFMIRRDIYGGEEETDIDGMIAADITFGNTVSGTLYSSVSWSGAVSDGAVLEDIGMTAMDNGLISFMKDRISNEQFLDLWLNSKITINSGNTVFFMNPVTGNTQMYSYPMEIIDDGTDVYMAGKGGFYQGFFELEGFDYKVLPDTVDDAWTLCFDIRPRTDYETGMDTVNYTHSGNSGIFFYIGTRAENKFWPFYKTNSAMTEEFKRLSAINDGYFGGDYIRSSKDILSTKEWLLDEPEEETYLAKGDPYFAGMENTGKTSGVYGGTVILDGRSTGTADFLNMYGYNPDIYCGCGGGRSDNGSDGEYPGGWCECEDYFADGYLIPECPDTKKAIAEEYIMPEVDIDFNGYDDSVGRPMSATGYHEILTDNKFLLFDQTRSGFTVNKWSGDTKVMLRTRRNWPNANYFILMNRTETGYTVDTIEKYNEEHQVDYSIYRDIFNNAFALRVMEDGAVGYRYGIRDCKSGLTYSVIEEYSVPGMVKPDEWNSIVVKIRNIDGKKMRVMIYVAGRLVLSSKSMDILRLHAIDDVPEKQQGVPYNISIGGGTLGLMETILPDYYAIPDYVLPLEKDFCGAFMGDVRTFRFYCGDVSYSAINHYSS